MTTAPRSDSAPTPDSTAAPGPTVLTSTSPTVDAEPRQASEVANTGLATADPAEATTSTPAYNRWAIAVIAILAGFLATIAQASPTGDRTVDVLLTFVTVAGITWLGAAATRWDASIIAIAAGLLSWSILGAVVGLTAAVTGFLVPVKPAQRTIVNAILIGIALNIAARSQLGGFMGASAIVFVALALYLGIAGFVRRQGSGRRWTVVVVGTATVLAFIGTLVFGVSGYLAINDIRDANGHTRDGLDALGKSDIPAARDALEAAATSFEAADNRIDAPIAAIARWIPGVSQHHQVATALTAQGAQSTRILAEQLQQIDLDGLKVSDGRIDVEKVRALQAPLRAVSAQIESLGRTIADVDSPWLVAPVGERLDELASEVADQRQRSDDALAVAAAAPGLLGGDGPRTYFLGFTTPAEARGSGGFMGNWAEITVTDGQIAVTKTGRADDLNVAGDPTTRRFTSGAGLDEWLRRYGPWSIESGPDDTTGSAVWKNINMSPDAATTGRAIADLYPQSGGRRLDGVFMMDVATLSRLLLFTGPVGLPQTQLPDGGEGAGPDALSADTAADFLLNEQYDLTDTTARVDILDEFSRSVVEALLSTTLPPPTDLLDVLGPMVEQGRFTGWAADQDEQEMFERIGLSGTLPDPTTGDGIAIAFNNAAGSKIDYYLVADAAYSVTADAPTSIAQARLDIDLTNNAPATGEPKYVISNLIGLPKGSNRTWVSVFTQLPVTEVRLDDQPVEIEIGTENGYYVTSVFVILPPGGSKTLTLDMAGRLDVADGYQLSTRTPPTVGPTPIRVDATWVGLDGTTHRTSQSRSESGTMTLSVTADR